MYLTWTKLTEQCLLHYWVEKTALKQRNKVNIMTDAESPGQKVVCSHVKLCFCLGRGEERGGFSLQVRETLRIEWVRSVRRESQLECMCVCVWMQKHDLPDKRQSELHRLQLFPGIKPSVKYPLQVFDFKLKGNDFYLYSGRGSKTNSTDELHFTLIRGKYQKS